MKKNIFFTLFFIFLFFLLFLIKTQDPKINYSGYSEEKTQSSELILNNLNKDKVDFIFIFSDKIYTTTNKQTNEGNSERIQRIILANNR